MSLVYLLDTNIISEPLKEIPNQTVIEKLELFGEQIAISSFVVYEMIRGLHLLPESRKRLKIFGYIESVPTKIPVLPYTKDTAIWHGEETARLQNIGKLPPFIDAQIASIAKINDLILVTRNVADFQNFGKLENWFE